MSPEEKLLWHLKEEKRLRYIFAERCIRDWYRSEPELSQKLKELDERFRKL